MVLNVPYNCINIPFSIVCASGATVVDQTINMPIAPGPGLIPCLIGVTLKHPPLLKVDTAYSKWALSVRPDTVMEELSNQNVIEYGHRVNTIAANGQVQEDLVERLVEPAPVPVSLTQIHFLANQTSGASHTYEGHLKMVWREIYGLTQKQNQVNQSQY